MHKSTYTLWSLDVWGNEREGFEVNDRCCLSREFEVEHEGSEADDEDIRLALVAGGYLKPRFRMAYDGDEVSIFISHKASGRPLFQLELI